MSLLSEGKAKQDIRCDEAAQVAFIIAAPRSGTTWTLKALNAHSDILAVEQRLFGKFREIWRDAPSGSSSLRITMDAFVETFLRTYGIPALGIDPQSVDERFTAKLLQSVISFGLEESGKKMLVDKITPYEGTSDLVRKQLERYFPAAKKIFLLRDPRDVVLSNVFLWLGRNPNPSSIQSLRDRVFLLKATENYQRFLCNSDLDRFCDQWMDAVRYLMPLCGMTIRYEDLLLDQASQLAAIFQYLSVECSAQTITGCCEASSFYRMTGGRARGDERVTDFFRKGIAGDWRNYLTQGDGAAIDSRIGEMMIKLGYVTDRGWFLNLPGERVVSR